VGITVIKERRAEPMEETINTVYGLPQFMWEGIFNVIITLGAGLIIAFVTTFYLKKKDEITRVSGVILEKRKAHRQAMRRYRRQRMIRLAKRNQTYYVRTKNVVEKGTKGSIPVKYAQFDFQKLENLLITAEEYQKGDLYGYQNMREFIVARQEGKCLLCKGHIEHLHHVRPRLEGGQNNLFKESKLGFRN
jgi:hypothetical protein